MSNYTHLTASERYQIADLKSVGSGVQAIAAALGRSASTISRELQRNALDSGAYRPAPAEGAYLLRRQRPAKLERDNKLRSYVLARLSEGWTPEQICGRLRQGIERGLSQMLQHFPAAFTRVPVDDVAQRRIGLHG
jgi:transposase, IS30 family